MIFTSENYNRCDNFNGELKARYDCPYRKKNKKEEKQ